MVHFKVELIAPFPHQYNFVLGVQDLLAGYLFLGALWKFRGSDEIESVIVKQMCEEVGRHGDQARCPAGSSDQVSDRFDVVELGCRFERRSDQLRVQRAPQCADLLGETKCIDFAAGELFFQPVKVMERSRRLCNLNAGRGLDQQRAIHVKDEEAIRHHREKSLVGTGRRGEQST